MLLENESDEHVIEVRLQFKFDNGNPIENLNGVKDRLSVGILPPIDLCIGGAVRLLIREKVNVSGREFKSWIEIPDDAEFEEVHCEAGDGATRRFVINIKE